MGSGADHHQLCRAVADDRDVRLFGQSGNDDAGRPALPGAFRTVETVFLFMHPTSTLQLLPMPAALADAGLHVLCCGSRYAKNDSALIMEKVVYDLGAYVRYAREVLGYRYVVLVGWSGGGAALALLSGASRAADDHALHRRATRTISPRRSCRPPTASSSSPRTLSQAENADRMARPVRAQRARSGWPRARVRHLRRALPECSTLQRRLRAGRFARVRSRATRRSRTGCSRCSTSCGAGTTASASGVRRPPHDVRRALDRSDGRSQR